MMDQAITLGNVVTFVAIAGGIIVVGAIALAILAAIASAYSR